MANSVPPTVDIDYILELLNSCAKVQGHFKKGQSTFYVMRGSAPIANRTFLVRCIDSAGKQVDFDSAVGIAMKIRRFDDLYNWLKANRNYQG